MFSIGFLMWAATAAGVTVGFGLLFRRQPQIVSAILMFIGFYIIAWLTLPPLSPAMPVTWLMLFLVTLTASGITIIWATKNNEAATVTWSFSVPIAVLMVLFIGSIASSGLFRDTERASVADITDHGVKDTALSLVSQERAQRVTSDLALKRGAELIGAAEESGLASRAKYGTIYANVNESGEPIWISPLVHTGFFRWWVNESTPGYFVASHIHNTDARLVENQPIWYGTEGFYWTRDLSRHIYLAGYVNYNYGDAFFQVDDSGVPHYVVPLERPQVGFAANFPERWLIVNATTGDITEANTVEEIPQWVDRAYSQTVMSDRLSDWGCFSAGWFACYFSGENVIQPTPGVVVTMDTTNTLIYVTGTQFQNSETSNGATSGVATINARTGKVEFYRRSGISETTASQTINGAVSNFEGWTAADPILIQVNGRETYFSVITDAHGARKAYGLISQRSRDVYGTGDTVAEAVRAYMRSARDNRGIDAFEGNEEIEPTFFEGLLVSLQPVIQDGQTYFYVRLDTVSDKVFLVSGRNMTEAAVSAVGEPIVLSTTNTDPALIEVETFDNAVITLAESEMQQVLDERATTIKERYEATLQRSDLDAALDRLTPEEVELLLRNLREDGTN